jgi:tRNA-intron endonuclease
MGDERQSVIKKVKGLLMKDRVIIWDETVAKKLHEHGFYGKLMGNWLQLSLIEAAYLMKENVLSIVDSTTGREIDWDKFMVRTLQVQPDFELRLKVYGELKNRNLIVKTGFKYGAHFRAYKRDPEETHADYLIHGVPDAYEGSWSEVSRAVRLAHGVRKEMIFARVLPKGIDCIKISRIKP